jgi:hypothetical protein
VTSHLSGAVSCYLRLLARSELGLNRRQSPVEFLKHFHDRCQQSDPIKTQQPIRGLGRLHAAGDKIGIDRDHILREKTELFAFTVFRMQPFKLDRLKILDVVGRA